MRRTVSTRSSTNVDDIGAGLLDYLFGPKRNKRLKLKQFHQFLQNLRWEMDDLEFRHYDCKKNADGCLRDFGYPSADPRWTNSRRFYTESRSSPGSRASVRSVARVLSSLSSPSTATASFKGT